MKADVLKRVFLLWMVLLLPAPSHAQEAIISGNATDSTGAVLPGVTVTATHTGSGNTFVAVTDERGDFRMPIRVGTYRVTAELSGFASVNRMLQVLVGQTAVLNVQMALSTIQESVTVTGEAPLVDTTTSTIAANIDPRMTAELPLNGRNWMDLTLLAPGARRNEAGGLVQLRQGYAQTNLDGQQVTSLWHSNTDAQQPSFNRDAIAEFEVIANRFDATQGRSQGMVVNAITKSGTNIFAGTFSSYFRHDRFNAADLVEHRVLPYSNQQVSGTFGGPIVRDRIHFFGSYGYEREPQTFAYTSPYPSFNIDQEFTGRTHQILGRLDYQFTPQMRLSVRGSLHKREFYQLGGGSAVTHPSRGGRRGQMAPQYFGSYTQVVSNRTVNEIRGGTTGFEQQNEPAALWKGGPFPYRTSPSLSGAPVTVNLRGYTIGNNMIHVIQNVQTVRDDFTTSRDWGGRHDLKLGGEYVRFEMKVRSCFQCMGVVDARGGPVPANIESLFPVWNDAATWNLAPLSPLTRWVFHGVSDVNHRYDVVRHVFAGWAQDDWRIGNNLTLNLGVRYDVDSNGHSEKLRFLPWLPGDLPHDTNNVAPRVGINYRLDERTALRGGYGLFFSFAPNDGVHQTLGYTARFEYQVFNDGRSDFVPNWFGPGSSGEGEWGGPKPTQAQALQNACDQNAALFERWRAQGFRGNPPCVLRAMTQEITYPGRQTPYAHQASIGIQRQLADDMSFEANYVYTGGRGEEQAVNANLSYNPATGANYRFSDVSRRPFPQWGQVNLELLDGWSNYHAGDFTLTKRFSNRWQGSATYTLSYFRDAKPVRDQWLLAGNGVVARRPIGFPLAPDLGGEYGFASREIFQGFGQAGDQRHRAVLNGIWQVGRGLQVSGIYFYGSGERFVVNTGVDRRDEGGTRSGELRLRADGSIVPRTGLVGNPIHKVDLRLQQRIPLGGRVALDGLFEVFNLFNHANYGTYVADESNRNFGQPQFSDNLQYFPRMLQLGFRVTF